MAEREIHYPAFMRSRSLRFAALVAFELLAVAALVRLGRLPYLHIGWSDLPGWLATTPAEDVLAAVCRVGALGCAVWLLAGTLLYALAVASRVPAAIQATSWLTVPAVRRAVDRTLAATLVGAGVLAAPGVAAADAGIVAAGGVPAGFATPPPLPVPLYRPLPASDPPAATHRRSAASYPEAGSPGSSRPPSAAPQPAPPPAAAAPQPVPPPTAAAPQPAPPPAPSTRIVVAGDDLWQIAVSQVGAEDRDRLVAYWGALIRLNRPHLRSGDPDLIHPGEVLRLPPLP
jgi:nucleoid-associated protein YgaU